MPEPLSLRLFGPPQVHVAGQALPRLRSRRGILLLALLALRASVAVERDFLIGTLWPESDGPAGQESLRKTLGDLRAALGVEAWRLQSPARGKLKLDLSGEAFCDVLRFDAALVRWEKSGEMVFAEEAVGLYRGPFLEGVTDEWVLRERTSRDEAVLGLFEGLARRALEQGDPSRALSLVRRAERLEPLRESVQRTLYRALTEAGDFPAAQRAFRDFRLRLREELNLAPDAATVSLMQQLAQSPRRVAPLPALSEEQAGQKQAPTISEGLRHFPPFLTPLRGRESELVRLQESLASAPLTTLVGMGGVGKTRLAVAAALQHRAAVFVDLGPLPKETMPEDIQVALCRAVGVAGERTQERLRELFQESETLLVLDNGEPVLESLRTALRALLHPDQRVRLLVTSREPLGLRGERVLRLEPLGTEAALQLFQERAEAVGGEYGADDQETIRAICRRLDGLPLAIELAAARMALLTPARLLERLAAPLRLLSGGTGELPARQRSLRAVLEDSYQLLDPEERRALEALSVFVGPFRWEDAEAVLAPAAAEPLDLLDALYRASLLVTRPTGWTFLQPVRDFAAERLLTDPARARAVRHAHAVRQALIGEEAIQAIQKGIPLAERRFWERAEDRAAALLWAEHASERELAARLALSHACYLLDARRNSEAETLLERGLTLTADPTLQQALLAETTGVALGNGDLAQAQARLTQALALSAEPTSLLLGLQGDLAFYQERGAETQHYFHAAFQRALHEGSPQSAVQHLALYARQVRRRRDPALHAQLAETLERARTQLEALWRSAPKQATTLLALAGIQRLHGDTAAAVACLEELVALQEQQPSPEHRADAHYRLGALLFRAERPEEAEAMIWQACDEHRAYGDDEAARQALVNGLCVAKFTRWFGQALRLRRALVPEQSALDPTYLARTILFEGCVLLRHGSPVEARACLLEAAQRFRWLGDPMNETVLLRLAAWTHLEEGDLEQAHQKAQWLCTEAPWGRIDEDGRCRVFLAETLRRQGKAEAALQELEGLTVTPECHPARGLCWLDRGELDKAEQEFQAGCAYGEIELSVEWLSYSSLGLADIAWQRGQKGEARAAYRTILTRALRAEDHVAERLVRARQGSL